MAPKEKVTPEQKAYLLTLVDDYLEVRKKGDYAKFWARLFPVWFKLWPVEVDMSVKDEEERRKACGDAIKRQEAYLKTWYRNHTAPKTRVSHAPPELDVTIPKVPKATRCLQEVEIYSKKYYSTRVAPLVDAAFVGKPEPTSEQQLKVRRKITQEALDNETPEIKNEISTIHKEALRVRGEQKQAQKQKVEPTPECYAAGIKAIEPNFRAFAERVGLDSGWSLTLIVGGPDPMNAGQVKTASFHYGQNVFGLTYSQHEPDFKAKFIPSYANFLQTCYSPEQCSIRALNRPSGTAPSVPNASAPPEEATKTGKAPKAATQPRAGKSRRTTAVATTAIPTPKQVATATTLPSVADTTLTSDMGATWEPLTNNLGAGLALPFPPLPPDLDYLNDPANFPNTFPIVSNVPMSMTIPSSFVVPPLGTHMSLLDELGGPLPSNLLGMPAQTNPYYLVAGAMDATAAGMMPTAPPLPYLHETLPVGLNASINGGFVSNPDDASANDVTNVGANEGVALNVNNGAVPNTDDNPNTSDNVTNAGANKGVALNVNNGAVPNTDDNPNTSDDDEVISNPNAGLHNGAPDASGVPKPSTRIPRKRRCDEIDPKFIVEGKRVRKQQVRTEIEALTHKGTMEKENK